LQVDTDGLRGLGNAHFAALQATIGDGRIQESDGWREPRPTFCHTEVTARGSAQGDGPESQRFIASRLGLASRLGMAACSATGLSSLNRLKQTRNVYFAAARCHAMNVTL
jgi:hypothetical protein